MTIYNYDEENYDPAAPKAKVKITTNLIEVIGDGKADSIEREMLIDTGSDICIIHEDDVKELESKTGLKIPYDYKTVKDFNGETFCLKSYFLKLQYQLEGIGDGETRSFLETKDGKGLLGRDVLNKYSMHCDGPMQTLRI